MAALPGDPLRALIARVRRGDDEAWAAFVDQFAPVLLHAARTVERDPDAAADAFVFTCERLRERRAARLAAFDFERPGRFETWLRAVALNLCRESGLPSARTAATASGATMSSTDDLSAAARTLAERDTVERLLAAALVRQR